MTLHEKLHLLSGDGPLVKGLAEMARHYNETAVRGRRAPRLGLPGIRFSDGPRGVVMGHATAFPVPMARGATFDPELEERVGDVIGVECRALGANLFAGVCVNLLRHPAWGRAQETFGEDPHLLGEMGAALVRGTQRHVMACVKHFACNSMEDARLRVDVSVDDDDLRDVYLPHFRRCIDAGAAAVMTAYNKVNGERCGHHHHLITEVLKGEWGFDGFVMSDFVFGVRSGAAVAAGQDLEMPFRWRFRSLGRHVRQGTVTAERVDDAVRRLVRQQVRFADRTAEPDRPGRYSPAVVASRRAPGPCPRGRPSGRWCCCGTRPCWPRAPPRPRRPPPPTSGRPSSPSTPTGCSRWPCSAGWPRSPSRATAGRATCASRGVVTLLDGLRAAGERFVINVAHHPGDDLDAARLAAGAADVAVVVVGYTHRDEGENVPGRGGDRRSLTLHAEDEALIRTAAAANPRTVVVLVGGSAIVTESWRDAGGGPHHGLVPGHRGRHRPRPPAVRRGRARRPPAQHLAARRRAAAAVRPRRQARALRPAARLPADGGDGSVARLPVRVRPDLHVVRARPAAAKRAADGTVRLTVPVVNTGVRTGDEVVQVYLDEALGTEPRPLRTLRAFRRVTVAPGALANVVFELGPDVLARTPRTADGKVRLHVGRDADPAGHRTVEA